jgi:hypothetical protein
VELPRSRGRSDYAAIFSILPQKFLDYVPKGAMKTA